MVKTLAIITSSVASLYYSDELLEISGFWLANILCSALGCNKCDRPVCGSAVAHPRQAPDQLAKAWSGRCHAQLHQ